MIVGAAYFLRQGSTTFKTFTPQPISFSYHKDYQQSPPSQPTGSGLSQLLRLDAQNPPRTITLKHEKDAKTGATLTKQNFLDFLEKNASTGFPRIYKGFSKDKIERRVVSGVEISDFRFSYTGKDNHTQVFIDYLIIPLGNDAYYITIQSTDKKNLDSESKSLISSLKISR